MKKNKSEIRPIRKVLEAEKTELDSEALFRMAGYPSDADTEVIEHFFLELRKGILDGEIESFKEGDKEFFKKKG